MSRYFFIYELKLKLIVTHIEICVLMASCSSTVDLATLDDATLGKFPGLVVNLWNLDIYLILFHVMCQWK